VAGLLQSLGTGQKAPAAFVVNLSIRHFALPAESALSHAASISTLRVSGIAFVVQKDEDMARALNPMTVSTLVRYLG
jgi:hypothetical protein